MIEHASRIAVLLLAAILATFPAACAGEISRPPGDRDPTSFTCDPDLVPASVPLRRLSRVQYLNTIEDLIREMAPTRADEILDEIGPELERMPVDTREGPDHRFARFARLDQALQQGHVDQGYALAVAIGRAMSAVPARLAEVAGSCATDTDTGNDDTCLDAFIQKLGALALRRPLAPDDIASFRAPVGAPPFDTADWADVVTLIMSSPYVGYHVEHGQDGDSDLAGRVPLTGHELAARLSYQYWQTMPDAGLREAAASGEILTDDGFAAQLDRVLDDPRADRGIAAFFAQWLENSALEELDSRVGTPVFDALADGQPTTAELREEMWQEVSDAAIYYTRNGGSFRDFFTSDRSFARSDELAQLYGVPPWNGDEPPAFDDPARVGLLTRAALLATGSANTRPIMKGVYIRKVLLCDEIPPPPANVAGQPPELSDTRSTRDVVEQLTGAGTCAGCHATLINPLGFATENFDSLGRTRSVQLLFDADGNANGTAPVDTSTVPAVEVGDDTPSAGAGDLTQLILASPKPHACFARQYFRFTHARVEDDRRDGCTLGAVKGALDRGEPMIEVLRAIALEPSFRHRAL